MYLLLATWVLASRSKRILDIHLWHASFLLCALVSQCGPASKREWTEPRISVREASGGGESGEGK